MLETALSLNRCVSAAGNTAVVLVLTAVCDVQSRVVSLSAITFTGFGTVMSVPLGLTAPHGVSLRSARGYLLTIRRSLWTVRGGETIVTELSRSFEQKYVGYLKPVGGYIPQVREKSMTICHK